MTRYTLRDHGYTGSRVIMTGRKKVGQVRYNAETKIYTARVGDDTGTGSSYKEAFNMLFVNQAGFDSVTAYNDDMRAKNAITRRKNNERKDRVKRDIAKYGFCGSLDRIIERMGN